MTSVVSFIAALLYKYRYTTDSRDAFPAPAPPMALQASDPKTAAARLELAVHGSKASGAPLGRAGLYSMTRLDNWESSERFVIC